MTSLPPDRARPSAAFAALVRGCVRDLALAGGGPSGAVDALLGGLKETIRLFSAESEQASPDEGDLASTFGARRLAEIIGEVAREQAEAIVQEEFESDKGREAAAAFTGAPDQIERLRARLRKLPADLRALERKPRDAEELARFLAGALPRFEPGQLTLDGNYELLSLLGSGDSSEVWAARNLNNGKIRALKFAAAGERSERLREEVDRLRGVVLALGGALPGVARVESIQEGVGASYIAMEYCEGGNLFEAFPPSDKPPLREILAAARPSLEALAMMHAAGHVHCGIEPSNVLVKRVESGRKDTPFRLVALLADYGPPRGVVETSLRSMALLAAAAGSSTAIAGSFAAPVRAVYMAPEMRRGKVEIDDIEALKLCDVYAFGVTLAQTLAGDPALEAGKLPRKLRKELPYGVMDLIAAATEHDPDDRPADAGELFEQFRAIDSLLSQASYISSSKMASSSSAMPEAGAPRADEEKSRKRHSRDRRPAESTPPSAGTPMAPWLGESPASSDEDSQVQALAASATPDSPSADFDAEPEPEPESESESDKLAARASASRTPSREEQLEALLSANFLDDYVASEKKRPPSPADPDEDDRDAEDDAEENSPAAQKPSEDSLIDALLGAVPAREKKKDPGEDTMIGALLAGILGPAAREQQKKKEPSEDSLIGAMLAPASGGAGGNNSSAPSSTAGDQPRKLGGGWGGAFDDPADKSKSAPGRAPTEEEAAPTLLLPRPGSTTDPAAIGLSEAAPRSRAGDITTLDLGHGVLMNLMFIPSGSFMLGSPLAEPGRKMNEGPQTRVALSKSFLLAETSVTQAQWEVVMGTSAAEQRDKANPAWPMRGEGPDFPMYYITWEEALAFCNKLSLQFGLNAGLPTEAQWEYACRAGTKTPYFFGDDPLELPLYAWRGSTLERESRPLGRKRPNPWGLRDMHGNVWEWCLDQFGEYPGRACADWQKKAEASSGGEVPLRSLRGGAWNRPPADLRSASRSGFPQNKRASEVGFRVAASPR